MDLLPRWWLQLKERPADHDIQSCCSLLLENRLQVLDLSSSLSYLNNKRGISRHEQDGENKKAVEAVSATLECIITSCAFIFSIEDGKLSPGGSR